MKIMLRHLWFLLFVKEGHLVSAKTIPLVMSGMLLEPSIEVIGTYIDRHRRSDWCYIRGLDGDSCQVYIKSIKKVDSTKDPELFI